MLLSTAKAPVKLTKDVKKQYIKVLIDFMTHLAEDQLVPELNYYKTGKNTCYLFSNAVILIFGCLNHEKYHIMGNGTNPQY